MNVISCARCTWLGDERDYYKKQASALQDMNTAQAEEVRQLKDHVFDLEARLATYREICKT